MFSSESPFVRAHFGVCVTSAGLGLPQLSALHPKVLQVPFVLVKIPPSAQILLREGGKSRELVQPLLLGCGFYDTDLPPSGSLGFALQPVPTASFCRGFHSPASLGTQMCCWAWTAAWTWKML